MEIALGHLFCVIKFQWIMWCILQSFSREKWMGEKTQQNGLGDLIAYCQSFTTQIQSHLWARKRFYCLMSVRRKGVVHGSVPEHIRKSSQNLIPLFLLNSLLEVISTITTFPLIWLCRHQRLRKMMTKWLFKSLSVSGSCLEWHAVSSEQCFCVS